ncbi:MAG: PAS domain S-box protein, partial [Nitrospirota bacterium]
MEESSTHHHMTILNVDDDEALAYARTRILTQAGYSVVEARSGEEGLKLLPLLKPQLLMLGVNLPGIDGPEVCRKVKNDPATQHVMVLQVSMARGTSLDRAAGLDGGADAYLVEPIEPVELIATVRVLLRLASREMDNRRLIQQLRRIERQFADATEAAECGLWDWDIVNGKLEWFGVHDRLAGMSPGKFSGQIDEFFENLHPDDRERVRRTLHETMARREERYVGEYRFVHPDGSVHWMLGTGRFIYNEQGPLRMTGIVRDVTERKQIEIALRDSEERLRHAAESLSLAQRASMSGVWDWNMTTGDIYVSPEYRRLFGFSEHEPVPFNRWLEAVHEEDRSAVEADERRLLDSGIDWSVEFRIVHPERGLRWLASIGRLERDDAGRPRRFSGVTLDITDRKQTERRTRLMATETLLAAAKFRAVFDQSAMFAVVMSLDGIVLEANRACLDVCGYHAKEVLGRSFWNTLWWRGSQEVQSKIQAGAVQAAHGIVYREELPYWWADGTEHLVDFSLHPIWNEQGAVMCLYSTGVDITERKRRESNLAFLANLQGTFSHLASVEEITQLVTEKIVAYLGLSRCLLVELSDTPEQSKVLYEHVSNERSSVVEVNSIKELHTEDELRRLFAGHAVVINDVRHESRPEDTPRLMALEAGALASAPYVSHGRWTLVLSVIHHAPHRWRADETELLTELAWRTYFRLERARTEEALRVSEQEFRSLAEAVPQLVWAARPDGWNIYFNQQWLDYTGLTPEKSYGYGWDTLFHADDDQRAQEAWQRANQLQEPYEVECRLRRADGVYRWWLVRGVPIFNANGMIQKWFGTCTDIEDLKQVEQ